MHRHHHVRGLFALAHLVCFIVLCEPLAAGADELTRNANTAFALNVLDMATTRLSIAHTHGNESNPFARPFVRSDAGALGYAVIVTAIERIVFRKHPRAFTAVDAMEAYVVTHNYMSRLAALDTTHAREVVERKQ